MPIADGPNGSGPPHSQSSRVTGRPCIPSCPRKTPCYYSLWHPRDRPCVTDRRPPRPTPSLLRRRRLTLITNPIPSLPAIPHFRLSHAGTSALLPLANAMPVYLSSSWERMSDRSLSLRCRPNHFWRADRSRISHLPMRKMDKPERTKCSLRTNWFPLVGGLPILRLGDRNLAKLCRGSTLSSSQLHTRYVCGWIVQIGKSLLYMQKVRFLIHLSCVDANIRSSFSLLLSFGVSWCLSGWT
jgi:hypothetical protein